MDVAASKDKVRSDESTDLSSDLKDSQKTERNKTSDKNQTECNDNSKIESIVEQVHNDNETFNVESKAKCPDEPKCEIENDSEKEDNTNNTNASQSSSDDSAVKSDKPVVLGEGDEHDADGDPIPSGTGSVSKDCTPSELYGWTDLLPKWHSKLHQRPKGLAKLVRCGIPEPLRGEVWQLLSGAHESSDLMDRYRIYLTKQAACEQIILRDVHRTYPAHENFRLDNQGESNSLLDSLFKVCKAYAVYDEEVGYCQGLSFLVAALLLHMPEEQAFVVFVRIMQTYKLRDLFRNNFDGLYLKFYQLERLLEEHIPDLHSHFVRNGVEPFTYASQWFLTVFTAKFPLNAVFYIMDIFLLDGMDTIFQIALALLFSSKQELIAQDFEGILKYFRVQMPKRYRNQDNVQQLINASVDISLKKLAKHAKTYEVMKQREKLLENPLIRSQKENAKLTENNLRLEQENDDLARELVASKIQLRAQLDVVEDRLDTLRQALSSSQQESRQYLATMSDLEDEKARLEVEVTQLKEVCRRELNRTETELKRNNNIIADYKKICSQLSKRLDINLSNFKNFTEFVSDLLRDNIKCKDRICNKIFGEQADQLINTLSSNEQLEPEESSKSNSTDAIESRKMSLGSTDISQTQARSLGAYIKSRDSLTTSTEIKIRNLTNHIEDLEIELARTKLALVEAECKCQQLSHDMNAGVTISQPQSGIRRSPKVASVAFAKINNLISEKISLLNAPTGSMSSSQSTDSGLTDRFGDLKIDRSPESASQDKKDCKDNQSPHKLELYGDRC